MNTHTDPYARVEQRRLELISASSEKEQALLKRIAAARQQALDHRGEADKYARNHHLQKANDLKAAAELLEDEARRLTNVELPRLRIEAAQIRQNQHPELSGLMRVAEIRSRSSQEDQARTLQNALDAARAAFESHLVEIATSETIKLAWDLGSAATHANVDCGSLVAAICRLDKEAVFAQPEVAA
jgi:hypothetical protein